MSSILLHRERSCEDRPTRSTSEFRVERKFSEIREEGEREDEPLKTCLSMK